MRIYIYVLDLIILNNRNDYLVTLITKYLIVWEGKTISDGVNTSRMHGTITTFYIYTCIYISISQYSYMM